MSRSTRYCTGGVPSDRYHTEPSAGLEDRLVAARAKLRDIRAILNGPGPNGGWTRVDEDRQADLCDDLAERIGERP